MRKSTLISAFVLVFGLIFIYQQALACDTCGCKNAKTVAAKCAASDSAKGCNAAKAAQAQCDKAKNQCDKSKQCDKAKAAKAQLTKADASNCCTARAQLAAAKAGSEKSKCDKSKVAKAWLTKASASDSSGCCG